MRTFRVPAGHPFLKLTRDSSEPGRLEMLMRRSGLLATALAILLGTAVAAQAELTSISGSVYAGVQEIAMGSPGGTATASDSYPDPSANLPLQVVARLFAANDEAAAAVAAQFADPRDLNQPNPEEFALNVALLSTTPNIRYTATTYAQEVRGVLFTQSEFPLREEGESVPLLGQLFVDGALAVFSPASATDLTGAEVTLRITIVMQVPGQDEQQLFAGTVGLTGGPAGRVERVAAGGFPTATLIHENLGPYIDDFALFEVLILPRLTIVYAYTATIGQEFDLVARVEVMAENAAGEVGVAAVIGSPVDAIQEVIATVSGEAVAGKTLALLQQKRADPTGEPAFAVRSPVPGFLPGCGLFGIEGLLGCLALAGFRFCRVPRFRRPIA